MKIVISYPTDSANDIKEFLDITQEYMPHFQKRQKADGFKFNFSRHDQLNQQLYCTWFSALATRGLDPHLVQFDKSTNGISDRLTHSDVYVEFQNKLKTVLAQHALTAIALKAAEVIAPDALEKIIDIEYNDTLLGRQIVDANSAEKISNASGEKPGSQPSEPTYSIPASSIPTASIELPQDVSSSNENNTQINRKNSIDNPSLSLETKRLEKLKKFNDNLKLLHQKSIELYHLANKVETSAAFRIHRIAYEVFRKLETHQSNYITNEAISDEDFKKAIHQVINEPLTLKIRDDDLHNEMVNIKYELSQHPQWGVYNIIDHILWCIDVYRIVTGTRLSFLSSFQPEYRHQIANIEEEVNKFSVG